MKRTLLTGIAALLLATGAAHAQDEDNQDEDNKVEYDPGVEYDCGVFWDQVWVKWEHVLSTTARNAIPHRSHRSGNARFCGYNFS